VARSLNKAMLIGNTGNDPEIRTVANGGRVAQFSVATSRRWNDRNGQPQEKTEWHRVVAWDKPFNLVDVVERYVKKGDRIYVEGEIEYRQYQDKDGVTKYTTEIRAREVVLLGGRSDGGGGGGEWDRGGSRPAASGARSGSGGGGGGGGGKGGSDYDDFQAPPLEDDDDLPF
jgi:single-strand DNA-binding protein